MISPSKCPYTVSEEKLTNFLMPARRMASSKWRVPSMFAVTVVMGRSMDKSGWDMAAV
ncbi:hypothetical protein D3C73_1666640 [compost metagenome]